MNTPAMRYPEGIPPAGMSRSFVNNVRLLIQAQQRAKIRTEQRSGRLYKRALVRPLLPPVDGGKWNSKIFYKREETKKIDTACTVMVDVSGSMCHGSGKLEHASMATCLLVNVLSRALRVPTEVLAFAYHRGPTIGVVKDFDTALSTDEEIAGGVLTSFRRGGGGNDDANAVLYGYHRLVKRKERKKIMIVLSDGSPANDPNGSDPDSALLYVVDSIRKRKEIDLHGIGIMHDNVKRYYGNQSSVIHKSEDLERVLVATLAEQVFIQ